MRRFHNIIILAAFFMMAAGFYLYREIVAERPFSAEGFSIPNVPYYGFYNSYWAHSPSSFSAILMALEYYKDRRFSEDAIWKILINPYLAPVDLKRLHFFFTQAGYESEFEKWPDPESALHNIRFHFKENAAVLVIIYNKLLSEESSRVMGYGLAVGISEKEQKILMHDYYFGGYRRVSFEDFKKMIVPHESGMLAITQKEGFDYFPKGTLNENETVFRGSSHTERNGEMDGVGKFMAGVEEMFMSLANEKITMEYFIESLQKAYTDETFIKLPPAYRISFYDYLAESLLVSGKFDEAAELLDKTVLPLNKNLDAPFGYWTGHHAAFREWIPKSMTIDELSPPYILLALAHMKKGDYTRARKNFEKSLVIHPRHPVVLEALSYLEAGNNGRAIDDIIERYFFLRGYKNRRAIFGKFAI